MREEREVNLNIVKIALSFQLLFLAIILFDAVDVKIPVLREIIVFLYLLFIPGIVFLKVLEINVKTLKFFILSIGISVSIVTLVSTFGSIALLIVCEKPFSKVPLSILLSIFTISIIFFCWRKKNFYLTISLNLPSINIPLFCFLILILAIITIIGNSDFLTLFLLTIFSLIPIFILRKTDEKVYPFLIWIISLSLIIMLGYDWIDCFPLGTWKTGEVVKIVGFWDPRYPITHNSQIFIMIFHPIISILSELHVEVATKLIDSILFSTIPLMLFLNYKEFLPSNYSFLASILNIFYPFYLQLAIMNRTGFAFFFVSLFLLLIISNEINLTKALPLYIIFSFSLITSHHGIAYLFMLILIPMLLLFFFEKKFRHFKAELPHPHFILLFLGMAFSWYIYTSEAQSFNWGVNFAYHIITNLEDLFNPEESAAMRAFVTRSVTPSFSLEATKWLLFTLLLFILIGFAKLLYLYLKNKIDVKFAILTIAFTTVLIGITQMGLPRIFGFSLIFSAPLAIVGFFVILNLAHIPEEKSLLVFSFFLFLLFSFNYSIVANSLNIISGEVRDMALQETFKEKILESDNLEFKRLIYWSWQPSATVKAGDWLVSHQNQNYKIFLDWLIIEGPLFKSFLPHEYGGKIISNSSQIKLSKIEKVLERNIEGYVFLADHNINHNLIYIVNENMEGKYYKMSDYIWRFQKMNKIYDNSKGQVLATSDL